jgi:tRNA(adenine34) deaminase
VKPSAEETLIRQALKLAEKAAREGEVPVGAVVAREREDGSFEIVSRGHNLTEARRDPTGHAEIIALRKAAAKLGRWRLSDCVLAVSLEPCAMCAGAAVWGRIKKIIYGAADPKAGACGSVLQVASHPKLNHRVILTGGVLEEECGAILKKFFAARRKKK